MSIPRAPLASKPRGRELTVEERITRFAEMAIKRPYKPQAWTLNALHREWLLCLVCRLLWQAGRIQ